MGPGFGPNIDFEKLIKGIGGLIALSIISTTALCGLILWLIFK